MLHLNPIIYYYIILIVYNLRLGHTKIKPYAEPTKSVILLQMPQQNNDNFISPYLKLANLIFQLIKMTKTLFNAIKNNNGKHGDI